MAEGKGGLSLSKVGGSLFFLAVAGLGGWLIYDPAGFTAQMNPETGRAKAQVFKATIGFLINNIGAYGTGGVLIGAGLLGLFMTMKSGKAH
jgi:hypothetical protein